MTRQPNVLVVGVGAIGGAVAVNARLARFFADNLARYIAGEPLENIVT